MAVYRNTPSGFQEIQRRSLRFTIPILVVVVVYIIVLSNKSSGMNLQSDLLAFSLLLPAWWVGHFIGLKKQREIYLSYELDINPEYIERTQKKTPTIRIKRAHVKNIIVKPNRNGIIIQSGETSDEIWVGKHIENYDALIKELSEVIPPTIVAPGAEKKQRLISPVVSVIGIVSVGAAFLASDKWTVVVAGITAIVLFGYSLVYITRNKNVDSRTKRLSLTLLIVIALLAFVVYTKLTS